MSKSSSTTVALLIALMAVGVPSFTVANNLHEFGNNDSSRLATFDSVQGETSFALSLSPQVDNQSPSASDIVIYVDTSASQAGVFKKDTIATLKHLLASLTAQDRVKLIAVDLDPVELTTQFVRPDSEEMSAAMTKLQQRVSLGSTDISMMVSDATKQFAGRANSGLNKNVVYIGDGVTREGFLRTPRFKSAVSRLVSNRISVSSYAIGPERDVEMLAALANNTGGNLYIDSDAPNAMKRGAIGLSKTVHGSVFWPTQKQIPGVVTEIYPTAIPPLRSDRDTILIGSLASHGEFEIAVKGEINGEAKVMTWPVNSEKSNVDFAFLPKLVSDARVDEGLTLPTVGSHGLREIARVMSLDAANLAKMSGQALAFGDANAAKTLADAALKVDPSNGLAESLIDASIEAEESDLFAAPASKQGNAPDQGFAEIAEPTRKSNPIVTTQDDTATEGDAVEETTAAQGDLILGNQDPAAAQQTQDQYERLLDLASEKADDLIMTEERRIKIINDRFRARADFEMKRARAEMGTAPGEAVIRMKSMLDVLDQTSELTPSIRANLRNSLETSLRSARQRKFEFDDAVARGQKNKATSIEISRATEEYLRREDAISGLINRFESLMDEGNYRGAEDVVFKAYEMAPDLPQAVAGTETGRIAVNQKYMWELRRDRQGAFVDALYQSEKSGVGIDGSLPLIFPDAETWARKVALRKKYQDIRLTGNENDEKILRALNEIVDFNYDDIPFIEVMDELRDIHGINVVLDASARDDSLDEDEPITISLTGIRLKNALRLTLKDKNATFIVKDEVLKIISLDIANDPENFVTNVYNVGDLVAPRFNPGGANLGGQGGQGGGGGFGGGGQGGGGQGGGFGGGGRGGGGGGGVFCIEDKNTQASETSSRRNQTIKTPAGAHPFTAWSNYFLVSHPDPKLVRSTVRSLMKERKTKQVIGLVQGAIQNNQSQPWMYEAMVLAMQISGSPKSDIERALMSAVDLSGNEQDMMIVADYMVRNGMSSRAIRVLQSIANVESSQPEPFVLGLRAAQKINDLDGIKWASVGILNQAWPKHREVVKKAIHAADGVRIQLEKEGRTEELEAFNKQLDDALYRDVIVKVSWTGDADIDTYISEPGGTVCSRINPRTSAGGVMMGDVYSSNPDQSGELAEYYVLPRGFSGDYKLLVRRAWGEITAGKVTVAVYTHFRTDQEESIQRQIELSDKGTIVLFSLKDGRRTESLENHMIQERAADQFVINRSILAQQFSENYSSSSASEYYRSRPGANPEGVGGSVVRRGQFVRRPGDRGYQPVISQIFEGSNMTVNHATTADRLYVLVSVTPLFQQILDVQVFNVAGGAGNATGGGGGVGGGGGALGGGAGGGGGGAGGGLF